MQFYYNDLSMSFLHSDVNEWWRNFCYCLTASTTSTAAAPWYLASAKNLRFVHSNKNVSIILWGMPVICGKANLCKKWQPNLKSRRFYAPPHSRPVAFLKLIKTCRWKENPWVIACMYDSVFYSKIGSFWYSGAQNYLNLRFMLSLFTQIYLSAYDRHSS